MIKAISKRTFLLRQEEVNGKVKDVLAHKGQTVQVSEAEAVRFFNSFKMEEKDQKKVLAYSKSQSIGRIA